MTDAQAEAILGRRIQRRLATDSAYRNAENAEDQTLREMEITAQEEDRLFGHGYGSAPDRGDFGGLPGQEAY